MYRRSALQEESRHSDPDHMVPAIVHVAQIQHARLRQPLMAGLYLVFLSDVIRSNLFFNQLSSVFTVKHASRD
jgi:hypothetical protein